MCLKEAKSSSWIYKEIYIYICVCVCVCVFVSVAIFNMIVKIHIPLYVSLRVILVVSKLVGESTIKIIGNSTKKSVFISFLMNSKYSSAIHRM